MDAANSIQRLEPYVKPGVKLKGMCSSEDKAHRKAGEEYLQEIRIIFSGGDKVLDDKEAAAMDEFMRQSICDINNRHVRSDSTGWNYDTVFSAYLALTSRMNVKGAMTLLDVNRLSKEDRVSALNFLRVILASPNSYLRKVQSITDNVPANIANDPELQDIVNLAGEKCKILNREETLSMVLCGGALLAIGVLSLYLCALIMASSSPSLIGVIRPGASQQV